MTFSYSKEEWENLFKFGAPGYWDKESFASDAIYRGGEALVKKHLKDGQFLPHNLEDLIEEGLKTLSKDIIQLKTTHEVQARIFETLEEKKGLSIIRLGDGEVLALAHDILVSSEEINKSFLLKFALGGFPVPNHEQRDALTRSLYEADIIGIPEARYPTYQRLFNNLAKKIQLPLNKFCLTGSLINYYLNEETTCYHHLLTHYRVLLIGNRAKDGKELLNSKGYHSIVGTIPVPGITSVPNVLEQVNQYDFDVAFVSAGIPANLICVEIAKQNKVAIDFGHLIDQYNKGMTIRR